MGKLVLDDKGECLVIMLIKKILLFGLCISIASAALGSQNTKKLADFRNKLQTIYRKPAVASQLDTLKALHDRRLTLSLIFDGVIRGLRDKRQAIYRKFGFDTPMDVLEEMCALLVLNPRNVDFCKQINTAIEDRRLIFFQYVDALLISMKAGDFERPEEFTWTRTWSRTNITILCMLENLEEKMMEDIDNGKDPAETADAYKAIIEEKLRNRVAEVIGKEALALCADRVTKERLL